MNNQTFEVVTVGKPDIEAMSKSEQETFFSVLLARISALSEQQRTELSIQGRELCRTETRRFTATAVTT